MLKRMSLSLLAFIIGLGTVHANNGHKKFYKITIKNLTTGQPLTPVLVAIHSANYELVGLGKKASMGLSILARDGMTSILENELKAHKEVIRTKIGKGIILPGESESIVIEANNPYFKVSLVSMLARTNDAISVLSSASLRLKKGQKSYYLSDVYDAGVELNTESCSDIPAPPCGNPNVGQAEDSFIRPHAGIQLIGDLEANRDTFAAKIAKIIIERI